MQAALGVGDASMVARTIPFTTSTSLDREVRDRAYRRARNGFHHGLPVLLCYKSHSRLPQQNGQQKSWERRVLANWTRNVAMECGLWRSARTRRAPRFELGRNFRGA